MAHSQALKNAMKELNRRRNRAGVDYKPYAPVNVASVPQLPKQPETAVSLPDKVKAHLKRRKLARVNYAPYGGETAVSLPDKVKVYPTLMNGFIAQGESVAARLYMLLRLVDKEGRGWLDRAYIRHLITDKTSPYHMWTQQYFGQVLRKGNGRFWQLTHNGRIRYKKVKLIVDELDCGKLEAVPVYMPSAAIVESLKTFKANCLAAFHAGRNEVNPITRQVIRNITGVSETSQREYDKITNTRSQTNICLTGKDWNKENLREYNWKRGKNAFRFVDVHGKYSEPFTESIAYRLSNSYHPNMAQAPKGRQRRINREIDLVKYVGRQNAVQGISSNVKRRYYSDEGEAAKARSKNDHESFYRLGATFEPKADSKPKFTIAGVWGVV